MTPPAFQQQVLAAGEGQFLRASGSQEGRGLRPRGPSEYELSIGRITDTLRRDYREFFERPPDFDIYDDAVVFALGQPFHGVPELQGKLAYRRALNGLRGLARRTVEGSVRCTVLDGKPYGHALKVSWTCEGVLLNQCSVCIKAISLYSVSPHAALVGDLTGPTPPLHRVSRHVIEFVEIHPPSLRSMLLRNWWQPHAARASAPVLAAGSLEQGLASGACLWPPWSEPRLLAEGISEGGPCMEELAFWSCSRG